MDAESGSGPGDTIAVTGVGWEVSAAAWDALAGKGAANGWMEHDCGPAPYVKNRKWIKFMGKQDRLALCAAAKALRKPGGGQPSAPDGCDLFITVGYIPFGEPQARSLALDSQEDGRFSMDAFSNVALGKVNPVLAFSLLPNMPAHHIAANLEIDGEYMVTYPGQGQAYHCLQEASARLREGVAKAVLLGGTADQCNFLVENHWRKIRPGGGGALVDGAAFILLELQSRAQKRGAAPMARLAALNEGVCQTPDNGAETEMNLGPFGLPLRLAAAMAQGQSGFTHRLAADGMAYVSRWELP